MEQEVATQKMGEAIAEALQTYGPHIFQESIIPTNWVAAIEWIRGIDGSRVMSRIKSEGVTPWLATGLIAYAQEVDDVTFLIAGYDNAEEEGE